MAAPIRLVCPECDTIHRVKSVTLGKLYRCHKCKAGLVTMSPAVLECPVCRATTEPAHVAVSHVVACPECLDGPLLGVTFPQPQPAASKVLSSGPGVSARTGSGIAEADLAPLVRVIVDRISERLQKQEERYREITAEIFAKSLAASPPELIQAQEKQQAATDAVLENLKQLQDTLVAEWASTPRLAADDMTKPLVATLEAKQAELGAALAAGARETREQLRQTISETLASTQAQVAKLRETYAEQEQRLLEGVTSSLAQAQGEQASAFAAQVKASEERLRDGLATTLAEAQASRNALRARDEQLAALVAQVGKNEERQLKTLADTLAKSRVAAAADAAQELVALEKRFGLILAERSGEIEATVTSRLKQTSRNTLLAQGEQFAAVGAQIKEGEERLVRTLAEMLERSRASAAEDAGEKLGTLEGRLSESLKQTAKKLETAMSAWAKQALGKTAAAQGEQLEVLAAEIRESEERLRTGLTETLDKSRAVGSEEVGQRLAALELRLGQALAERAEKLEEFLVSRIKRISPRARPSEAQPAAVLSTQLKESEGRLHKALSATLEKSRTAGGEEVARKLLTLEKHVGRSLAEMEEKVATAVARRLEQGLKDSLAAETARAFAEALRDIPQALEKQVVTPLRAALEKKIPAMVADLQGQELDRRIRRTVREVQEPLVAEINRSRAFGWRVSLGLCLLLFFLGGIMWAGYLWGKQRTGKRESGAAENKSQAGVPVGGRREKRMGTQTTGKTTAKTRLGAENNSSASRESAGKLRFASGLDGHGAAATAEAPRSRPELDGHPIHTVLDEPQAAKGPDTP